VSTLSIDPESGELLPQRGPEPPVDADKPTDRLDLERWLRVLRRRWWVIAASVVLVTGSAAAFSLTQQKQYTASASLLFSQSQIGSDLLGLSNSSSNTSTNAQADNVKLVESSQVAAAAANALGRGFTAQRVASRVSVSAAGQSDFVSVQVTDPDPKLAARIANVYAQKFIAFRRTTNRSAVNQVRNSLQNQLQAMSPAQRRSPAGTSLEARIEQLNTLAAAQTGDVQLVQPASTPSSPSSPKTKLNVVLGAILGLVLGVGLVLLLERLNRRVTGVEELHEIYGYPVLAEVPESDEVTRNRKHVDTYEQSAFEMLRARLRYLPRHKVKSLLVTSCAPQEGKTTIAWNLAETTALTNPGRVLLIEADLRRPTIAAVHGLQPAPGLSDVLSEQCDFAEATQEVPVKTAANGAGPSRSIDVLVAGPVPPNPTELIESPSMHSLIRHASDFYDFVVIDTGPALLVPDTIALAKHVAGILVVSHLGGTTRDEAAALRDQLSQLGAPVVGVVANRVKDGVRPGYYYQRQPTDAP
jgi:polysaccharide biosynthesis transport protein